MLTMRKQLRSTNVCSGFRGDADGPDPASLDERISTKKHQLQNLTFSCMPHTEIQHQYHIWMLQPGRKQNRTVNASASLYGQMFSTHCPAHHLVWLRSNLFFFWVERLNSRILRGCVLKPCMMLPSLREENIKKERFPSMPFILRTCNLENINHIKAVLSMASWNV